MLDPCKALAFGHLAQEFLLPASLQGLLLDSFAYRGSLKLDKSVLAKLR